MSKYLRPPVSLSAARQRRGIRLREVSCVVYDEKYLDSHCQTIERNTRIIASVPLYRTVTVHQFIIVGALAPRFFVGVA
jgi:hypothetical protein